METGVWLSYFQIELIKGENNERHTEPALIRHETVHIAEVISEIQPNLKAEHKGTIPEIADKIVFTGSRRNYPILKVPCKESTWNNYVLFPPYSKAAKNIVSAFDRLLNCMNDLNKLK